MILQILPITPPAHNGLADYARKLSEVWPDPQESWAALALSLPTGANEAWPNADLRHLDPTTESLIAELQAHEADVVVLHYVPHGFDPNGVPRWLSEGLDIWKRTSKAKLFVVFHELFVMAKPWRRSYLYSAGSKACLQRIVQVADGWITSSDGYFKLACRAGADPAKGRVVPIGSAIELTHPCPSRVLGHEIDIIVFGLASTRLRTLRAHSGLLRLLEDQGSVRRLVLLGAAPQALDSEIATVAGLAPGLAAKVTTAYNASEADASTALCGADVGLCYTPASLITKSSVYAAYSTHGVVTVVAGKDTDVSGRAPIVINVDRQPERAAAVLRDPNALADVRASVDSWAASEGSWTAIAGSIYAEVTKGKRLVTAARIGTA